MTEPTPKYRPVFGSKELEMVPSSMAATQKTSVQDTATTNTSAKKRSDQKKKKKSKHNSNPNPKPISWQDYFSKMDSMARILFGSIVYRQPNDLGMHDFYSYNSGSLNLADEDLPDLDYAEIKSLLSQWKTAGLLVTGTSYSTYRLKAGVPEAYWQWLSQQIPLESCAVEPEKVYSSDIAGTLDNLLSLLVMIEHGEVLVTRTSELNKHSMKRLWAFLTAPVGPPELFNAESYLYWLFSLLQMLKLIGSKGDHLTLSASGKALPQKIQVENLLCTIYPSQIRAISLKGFFLILPILDRCTGWQSWAHMVSSVIADGKVGNTIRRERVIGTLDLLRFIGLVDWGEYQSDILVRATPLGQLLLPKLLREQKLTESSHEIKGLTDQVYPIEGPDTAYVQPNFEILLPHSASWAVRWELGQFALLEQQDQMLKYRLDKTYLLNALKRGLVAGDVLSLLTKLSPHPLPENLVITLQQWIESFGQVTFLKLSLLECTTPEQAASIASARKYKEYVLGLYSPTAVIIREPEKLRKLLEKHGTYPLPGVLDGEKVAGRKAH